MVYQKKIRISNIKYFLSIRKAMLAGVSRSVKKRQCFIALCLFPFYVRGEFSPPDNYSLSISSITKVTEHYQGNNTVEPGIKVTARLSPSPSVSNEKTSFITLHSARSSKTARIETSSGYYNLNVFSTGSNGAMEISVTPEGSPYPTNSLTVKPVNKTLTSFSIKDAISQTTRVVNFPSTKSPIPTKKLPDKLNCTGITVLMKKLDAKEMHLNNKEKLLHNKAKWLKKEYENLNQGEMAVISVGMGEVAAAIGVLVILAIKHLWRQSEEAT